MDVHYHLDPLLFAWLSPLVTQRRMHSVDLRVASGPLADFEWLDPAMLFNGVKEAIVIQMQPVSSLYPSNLHLNQDFIISFHSHQRINTPLNHSLHLKARIPCINSIQTPGTGTSLIGPPCTHVNPEYLAPISRVPAVPGHLVRTSSKVYVPIAHD